MLYVLRKGHPHITHVVGDSVNKNFTSENIGQTVIYVLGQNTKLKGSHADFQQCFHVPKKSWEVQHFKTVSPNGTQRVLIYGQLHTDQSKISHSKACTFLLSQCSSSKSSTIGENVLHIGRPSVLYYGLGC